MLKRKSMLFPSPKSGAAAMMAIRILLDHDVREEDIVLLSLLMAEAGVHSLAYAFPRVVLLTTAVHSQINEHFNSSWRGDNFGEAQFKEKNKENPRERASAFGGFEAAPLLSESVDPLQRIMLFLAGKLNEKPSPFPHSQQTISCVSAVRRSSWSPRTTRRRKWS
jgi:hypothetical protein